MGDLRRIAFHKTIAVFGIVAVAYPILLWWKMPQYDGWHTAEFWQWELLFPTLAAFFAFAWLLLYNRCPACKSYWCYHPITETPISDIVRERVLVIQNKVISRRRCVVEWQCDFCHYTKLVLKNRIVQQESKL